MRTELLKLLKEHHMRTAAWLAGFLSVSSAAVFLYALNAYRDTQLDASLLHSLPRIAATTQALPEQRLQEIARRVQDANPGIQVSPLPGALMVSVPDERGYAKWQQAVFGALKAAPEATWRIRRLCAGECGAAKAGFSVELLAESKVVSFQ